MPKRLTPEEQAHRQVTEKQLQSRIMDFARLYGWTVAHFHDSRRQVAPGKFVGDADARGFPDLVLCRPPELLFIELKRQTGKVTPEQLQWLGDLNESGAEAVVVRPSDETWVRERLSRSRRSPVGTMRR